MSEYESFKAWEQQFTLDKWELQLQGVEDATSLYVQYGIPTEEDYLKTPQVPSIGKYNNLRSSLKRSYVDGIPSIFIAQQIQRDGMAAADSDRLQVIQEGLEFLRQNDGDVKNGRFAIKLDDIHIAADLAGYHLSESADSPTLTLMMYELSKEVSFEAGKDLRTGRRFGGPVFTPVLAVRALSRISKG